jgi:hypothetical protein
MATSSSATAQSCTCSNVDGIAFDPDQPTPESLALRACDDTDSLREVHSAYACLEKLIVPLELGDTDELNPTRSELSALMRVINDELNRRIEAVDKAVHATRAAMVPSAFVPIPAGS